MTQKIAESCALFRAAVDKLTYMNADGRRMAALAVLRRALDGGKVSDIRCRHMVLTALRFEDGKASLGEIQSAAVMADMAFSHLYVPPDREQWVHRHQNRAYMQGGIMDEVRWNYAVSVYARLFHPYFGLRVRSSKDMDAMTLEEMRAASKLDELMPSPDKCLETAIYICDLAAVGLEEIVIAEIRTQIEQFHAIARNIQNKEIDHGHRHSGSEQAGA